ncbi:CIC11C00000004797 [Sungouiella intermedia]|uniref:beta-glucosidase n=1 Tax=Sungouiella intermedia TaxID=45354 RepID=A0A1L0BDG2_9ASCO|nr:CIC11C00000004797 [[Candida] intermedia]
MADIDVDYVLSELTLQEKVGLISGADLWHTYAVPRLGVPSVRVSDGPNGVRGTKIFKGIPAACFTCGTGLASTFNKELLQQAGGLMAEVAKHKSAHAILGPTTNMQRGPLGGRGFESFSEDPHLAAMASIAVVKGIQENDIAATIKHFVCNDLEHQREASNSIVSERALREIYLEPFRLAVKHANPAAFMTSYNKVNGVHVSQLRRYMEEILRGEWGWDGLIMSDWSGVYTDRDAIQNGLDLEMPGPSPYRSFASLNQMIKSQELKIMDLDARVKKVLEFVKWCARSNLPERGPEDADNNTPETQALLRKIACESIVLMKNDDEVLPLKKSDKIAIIGPNAKVAQYCGGGSASLNSYYTTNPFESIAEKLEVEPKYTIGCEAHKMLPPYSLSKGIKNPETKELGFLCEYYTEPSDSSTRKKIDEKHFDEETLYLFDYKNDKIVGGKFWVDIQGEFTPEEDADYQFSLFVCGTAKLFIDDVLVVDNWTDQKRGEFLFGLGTIEEKSTFSFKANKTYKIRIEYGSVKTSKIIGPAELGGVMRLGMNKIIDGGEEIARAAEIAKSVDKVVLVIGLNKEWESEGYDRPNMKLPLLTDELVKAVVRANPNTVIVNQSGTPVEMPWLADVKCLVQAWYGGSEGGNAIADVLFGDHNPSGKLSLSWPHKNSDNPAYLNFKTAKGRVLYGEDIYIGYRYYEKLEKEVAFPFGHGLSYTLFSYSELESGVDEEKNLLSVSFKLTNTGSIDGGEAVQIYLSQVDPTFDRPVKELKAFEKVFLKAGESTIVKTELSLKDSVSYFDEYYEKWNMEKGTYQVLVGGSSQGNFLTSNFDVKKEKLWTGL